MARNNHVLKKSNSSEISKYEKKSCLHSTFLTKKIFTESEYKICNKIITEKSAACITLE